MKLKRYKKNFESLYSHSIEEVEMLLSRLGVLLDQEEKKGINQASYLILI